MKQEEGEEAKKLWRKATSLRRVPDKEYFKIKESEEDKVQKQMLKIANEFFQRKKDIDNGEDNMET